MKVKTLEEITPFNLYVRALTDHSAVISWDYDWATSFESTFDIYLDDVMVDSNVASDSYLVTGLAPETTHNVFVKHHDNGENSEAVEFVTRAKGDVIPVESVKFMNEVEYAYSNTSKNIRVNVLPINATNPNVTFSLVSHDDTLQPSLTTNGIIRFRGDNPNATAVVLTKAMDNSSLTDKVTVKKISEVIPLEDLHAHSDSKNIILEVGERRAVNIIRTPDNATLMSQLFTSSVSGSSNVAQTYYEGGKIHIHAQTVGERSFYIYHRFDGSRIPVDVKQTTVNIKVVPKAEPIDLKAQLINVTSKSIKFVFDFEKIPSGHTMKLIRKSDGEVIDSISGSLRSPKTFSELEEDTEYIVQFLKADGSDFKVYEKVFRTTKHFVTSIDLPSYPDKDITMKVGEEFPMEYVLTPYDAKYDKILGREYGVKGIVEFRYEGTNIFMKALRVGTSHMEIYASDNETGRIQKVITVVE